MAAVKHDAEKDRWDLLPYDSVREVVKVLTYGAKKYEDRNWESGFKYSRIYGALQRHITAWFQDGEDNDPETGLSHLAHAGCCILFLLAFKLRGIGKDDRPKTRKVVFVGGLPSNGAKFVDGVLTVTKSDNNS